MFQQDPKISMFGQAKKIQITFKRPLYSREDAYFELTLAQNKLLSLHPVTTYYLQSP